MCTNNRRTDGRIFYVGASLICTRARSIQFATPMSLLIHSKTTWQSQSMWCRSLDYWQLGSSKQFTCHHCKCCKFDRFLIYYFRFHRHHCVSRTITPNIIRYKWVQFCLQINRSGWWSYRRNSCLPLRLTTAFAVIDRNIWNSLVRTHLLAQASFIRYMWEGILKTIFCYSKIQK